MSKNLNEYNHTLVKKGEILIGKPYTYSLDLKSKKVVEFVLSDGLVSMWSVRGLKT